MTRLSCLCLSFVICTYSKCNTGLLIFAMLSVRHINNIIPFGFENREPRVPTHTMTTAKTLLTPVNVHKTLYMMLVSVVLESLP